MNVFPAAVCPRSSFAAMSSLTCRGSLTRAETLTVTASTSAVSWVDISTTTAPGLAPSVGRRGRTRARELLGGGNRAPAP